MEKTSLLDYYDLLDSHDWYYHFSDDMKVYDKGEREEIQLDDIATQSPEHEKLYKGFQEHMFSGKPFNKELKSKPERPLEGA